MHKLKMIVLAALVACVFAIPVIKEVTVAPPVPPGPSLAVISASECARGRQIPLSMMLRRGGRPERAPLQQANLGVPRRDAATLVDSVLYRQGN